MGKRELRNTRKARKVKIVVLAADGRREKLSDRIYRIVQGLFFFRQALMKNMWILLILSNAFFPYL